MGFRASAIVGGFSFEEIGDRKHETSRPARELGQQNSGRARMVGGVDAEAGGMHFGLMKKAGGP